jgi:hypothetical protein
MKAWKAEHKKLTAKNYVLSVKHRPLKGEIKRVETVRRHAESIQRSIAPKRKLTQDIQR